MAIRRWMIGLSVLGICLCAGCGSRPSVKSQSETGGCDIFDECGDAASPSIPSVLIFAQEYAAYNGIETKKGKVYRTVSLSADTPFVEARAESVGQRLSDQESFYLYIGDPLCPWCRSVIEQAESVAKEKRIGEIVSVRIWDDNGEEILRDQYVLETDKPVLKKAGSDVYRLFLEVFDAVLSEYTLENEAGEEISIGEKRIYAPSFFRIEKGRVVSFTTGISPLQTDAYAPLTPEILADERRLFETFFKDERAE